MLVISNRLGRGLGYSVILAGLLAGTSAWAGPTLDAIKQRGSIKVGVGTSPGFFSPDSNGKWQGFFVDFGRALAVTVFGDADKVSFTSSSPQQRLPALQAGEFDILLSGVTQTATRSFKLGFHFGPIVFYDGQGLLVKKALGVSKAAELDGATIGIQSGTTGELNIADFFRKTKKSFKPVVIEETKEFVNALESGRVDALTQDASDLALRRIQLGKPDDYVLLPERLSKEPLAPAVRSGDDRWLEIVNWTVYATIQAEEYGITQANIDEFLKSEDPGVKRFLGIDKSLGEALELDPKFAYNIVKAVGNYGEIFERNIGKKSKVGFERGYNQPWSQGGLLYSPPFR
ncbi:General L-amino acid-binding periplasmic protein AapJ [Bosea sp. 62]|uniref:amino acid ABC transporter substrate-binding protein n=1 Tax=unclassified Bosea (in: a-proteobacteria) TaxID=2653178 RepID=UPI001255A3D3|nr:MULTISPECIES: amino acid ABC transporter substrate-binding protein [unclassified Bosea (in: a-proteobacteria)]CAD5249430.1 General L-amino acid-binding periplasmic protein AapJ [Bosea sp. 46]CAD5250260.1 General L-amino acid-binding periplasmic protein AapJ [Bosea sp. 21B]CAD5265055.1 General L-amino acid-binding periplasmic protein AapJ [Bosea sp. 7B]VVT44382.1 General L-amino acid-binding periplasmic protein AapJ [Bosea sp. EC-HK365B]VXB09425.1 General L-amino acid-binding periplasmic pro